MMMLFNGDESPRLLLGREALWLHGFPIFEESIKPLLDNESEAFLTDLAGNMVSTPVLLALLMSTISSLSWREEESPATTIDCRKLAESSLALCGARKTTERSSKGMLRLLREL